MVVPSQATPITHTHADMPDLNTCVPAISEAGMRHIMVITVAVANIIDIIASLRGNVGSVINPTCSEIAVA